MQVSGTQRFLLASAAFALLAISGCGSMSERECQTTDWRTVGYEDGVSGYSGDRIGHHRKACGKYGIAPNLEQYQAGRDQGLREFCKPANGFRYGARGNGYNGVCPANLDRDFVAAYESGRQLYALRSRVSEANNRVQSMHRELDRIDEDMIKVGAEILDPTITNEHRAQLLLDTKRMAERKGELRAEIPQFERDREEYERELESYRATLAYVE
jgi:hypothetical protein